MPAAVAGDPAAHAVLDRFFRACLSIHPQGSCRFDTPRSFGRRTPATMATTQRTAHGRVGFIVASAFFAGLAFAILVVGPAIWEPPPESSFRIDDAAVEAERPPVEVADDLPRAAVLLAAKPTAVPVSPERLALADAAAPIVTAIVAQALPTSGDRPVGGEAAREAAPQPAAAAAAMEADLVPTPAPAAAVAVPEAESEPPVPEESPELRAHVSRLQATAAPVSEPVAAAAPDDSTPPTRPAAPLPGEAWTDPDGSNWTESPDETPEPRAAGAARGGRLLGRLIERRGEVDQRPTAAGPPSTSRLLDRVRERFTPRPDDTSREAEPPAPATTEPVSDGSRWPEPVSLREQLDALAKTRGGDAAATWATAALGSLADVLATGGPRDDAGEAALIALGDQVTEGMQAADALPDHGLASRMRRAALAIARRVAVWRAAAACCAESPAASSAAEVAALLAAIERFESSRDPADARAVREAVRVVAATPLATTEAIDRAVHDHYLSPNVRIAVNERFVEKLLPETTVTTSPLHDYVLGRQVRGTKTVEQSTTVRFAPHPSEIRLDLLVSGAVASRTVTDAGSVSIHSRGQSSFTVFKPIHVSPRGLAFDAARGSASNQSQLAGIETGFDSVPLMGSLVRTIARNQHDENLDQATREVNVKIVSRACREVDAQTEPQLAAAAKRVRERFWAPMERLGLEPTAVALETTAGAATARLRLAAPTQLAAHTPRPRAPDDALFSIQIHESTVNNACGRLGLAGQKMGLEALTHHVCTQLGLPPTVPDDLPEGVEVTFAADDPVRVECRDGLVHVHVSLAALESGRRSNWYDIVAHVAYKPTVTGIRVALEREGPVQLSGPGQKGRMEFGLRTIFGKMFPKERPVQLVPETLVANRRFVGVQAVQAVTADGWLAIALSSAPPAGKPPATAAKSADLPQRILRR